MFKKRMFCIIITLILMLLITACSDVQASQNGMPEYFPKFIMSQYDESERVDIMTGVVPVSYVPVSQESINEAAECGYTIIIPQYEKADFGSTSNSIKNVAQQYLNYAQNAGLKVIIWDTQIVHPKYQESHTVMQPNYENVPRYKNHPAFYGIFIDDETPSAYWPELAQKIQFARDKFPDKVLLTNTCRQYKVYSDWKEQLEIYVDTVNPQVLSYDHYPIFDLYWTKDVKTDPAWLGYNAALRNVARKYGLISCNWILVTGGYWELAMCTAEDIRWQMAVCLAYGFDIIAEYAYNGNDTREEPFFIYPGSQKSEKLFDANGNRTTLYNKIKNVNAELHKWGFVYKHYDWYGTAVYKGTPGRSQAFELIAPEDKLPLSAVDGLKKITCNQDILIGAFRDEYFNNAIMITNAAEPNDPSGATTVTVEFDSKYNGVMVCDKDFDKENPNIITLQNGRATIELDASEGKFLVPLVWR